MVTDDGLAGLSHNGGFEQTDGDRPAGWFKFGGEMSLSDQAYRGRWAVSLASQGGSTKWLYQVIPITSGGWYEATGFGRIEAGAGEASIRVSWYRDSLGEGEAIATVESRVTASEDWAMLTVAPSEAPEGAGSVRLRLMLRATNAATAAFDDVVFREAVQFQPDAEPPAPPAAAATPKPSSASTGAQPAPVGAARLLVPSAASAGSLRISEVMPNPASTSGKESDFEWVELVNVSDTPITTAGWKLGDAAALDALPETAVPPGGYLIVAGQWAAFPGEIAVVRPVDGAIGSGLANDGDSVRLLAPDGTLADAVSYGSDKSVFQSPPKAPAEGTTIGIRSLSGRGIENWALTSRPTPGSPNEFALATPTPAKQKVSASTSPAPATVPVAVQRGADDGTVVPWMLLSVAGGAGLFASAELGARTWPRIRKRWRGGR